MTRRNPLPRPLRTSAFTIRTAHLTRVPRSRLGARDIRAPYYGVRSSIVWPEAFNAIERASREYLPRLRPAMVFSHSTAASLLGAPLPARLGNEPLHITAIPPRREPRTLGVIGHREYHDSSEFGMLRGIPITNPATTWVQLASQLSIDELIVVGDFFVGRSGLCSLEDLDSALDARGQRGIVKLRAAREHIRLGSESPRETETRLAILDGGLPEPELNWVLRTADRRFVARLDMAYPGYRVAVEYDGRQHAEGAQFEIDADRWYAIEREGWIVVRVLAHHLRSPGLVADRVREALTSRGWAPRANR